MKQMGRCLVLFLAGLVGAQAYALNQELIDFTALPTVPPENVRPGSIAVEDFPLPVVDNAGAPVCDHSQSTVVEREVTDATDGRAGFKTSVLTYPVLNTFSFPQPGHEISLWLHVSGPPLFVPGPAPFSSTESHPGLVTVRLIGQGKTFTSRKMEVTRGWNELKFYLSSKVNAARNATDFNNRLVHFTPEDESGTTIDTVQIVVDGTFDSAESFSIGKVRLNTCKVQPVEPSSVVMVYDDGWSGFYNYGYKYGILRIYQIPATLAVVKNYAAPVDLHMSLNQIKEVFNYTGSGGKIFDVVNHTMTHNPLHGDGAGTGPKRNYRTQNGVIGVYDDIFEGRKFLIDNGLTRNGSENFLIYPGGASDAQVHAAMEQIGIRYGRKVNCERNQNANNNSTRNPYGGECYDAATAENSWSQYASAHPLDEMLDWIDEGIETGRPRFIMWHDLVQNMPAFNEDGRAVDGWHTVHNTNTIDFHNKVVKYISQMRGPKCVPRTLPNWYNSLSELQRVAGVHY
ncbi:MAG: polysaccharide deacetylase family protein [Armatimonadetes bacterium]|nr:polysaccharide deacetylase family protein [Armatimonadota bacterium]